MNTQAQSSTLNPWPITLGFFFAILVTSVVAFGVYASTIRFDLVSEDYYAKEIAYQGQIDRIANTRPFEDRISIEHQPGAGTVTLALPQAHLSDPTFEGTAHFYRPSDAERDFLRQLKPSTGSSLTIDASALTPGLWKVRLSWTVGETGYYFEDTLVVN